MVRRNGRHQAEHVTRILLVQLAHKTVEVSPAYEFKQRVNKLQILGVHIGYGERALRPVRLGPLRAA